VANLFCGVLEVEGTGVFPSSDVEGKEGVGCVYKEDMVTRCWMLECV
jgi:hypothetical protein